jgi:hypothetical protein
MIYNNFIDGVCQYIDFFLFRTSLLLMGQWEASGVDVKVQKGLEWNLVSEARAEL